MRLHLSTILAAAVALAAAPASANTLLRNKATEGVLTLPAPYGASLGPGYAVVVGDTPSNVIATLGGLTKFGGYLEVAQTSGTASLVPTLALASYATGSLPATCADGALVWDSTAGAVKSCASNAWSAGGGVTQTATSGHILVADGAAWNSVALSGDGTLASSGALTVTGGHGIADVTTATVGTGASVTANSLTTGSGFLVTSSGTIVGAGKLVSLVGNGATTGAVFSASGTALTSGTVASLIGGGANMLTGGVVLSAAMGAATLGSGVKVVGTGAYTDNAASPLWVANNGATTGTFGTVAHLEDTGATTGKILVVKGGVEAATTTAYRALSITDNAGAENLGVGVDGHLTFAQTTAPVVTQVGGGTISCPGCTDTAGQMIFTPGAAEANVVTLTFHASAQAKACVVQAAGATTAADLKAAGAGIVSLAVGSFAVSAPSANWDNSAHNLLYWCVF